MKVKRIDETDDYYEILGLPKEATEAQVKSAYKKLALKYHPDKAGESSKETFQKISEAYEHLVNTDKRSMYDKYGKNPEEKLSQFYTKLVKHFNRHDIYNFLFCVKFQDEINRREKSQSDSKEKKEGYNRKLKKYFFMKFFFTIFLIFLMKITHGLNFFKGNIVQSWNEKFDFCENSFVFPFQKTIKAEYKGKTLNIIYCHKYNFEINDKIKKVITESKIKKWKFQCKELIKASKEKLLKFPQSSQKEFQAIKSEYKEEIEACNNVKAFEIDF